LHTEAKVMMMQYVICVFKNDKMQTVKLKLYKYEF